MPEFEPVLFAIVSTLLGGGFSAIVATVTRRFSEPSKAEISQAETYASEAWLQVHGGGEPTPQEVPPLLQGGDAEAIRILTEYAEDLRGEADRIAKRTGAESASATHIRLAADRLGILRQRASALADIGLAVGALVLGGAVSYEINLLTGGDAAPGSEPWVIGVGAFGLAVFVVAATVKWVKR